MHDTDRHPPVTVIGLGALGSALAGALVDRGHPTTVWNRTPGKDTDLVARGARSAGSAAEAIAASPLVIVCVLDYAAAREILDPAAGALPGRALVNLTNGTPTDARTLADWASAHGADYLDGGVMAIPPMIGRPEALVLYSGSAPAFETHGETLRAFGTARYLGTDAGLAPLHDLALLSGMYGMFAGAMHAIALVGTEEVTATDFTADLLLPWLTAMSGSVSRMAEQVDSGDHGTDVVSNLAMQAAGFPNLVRASRDQGIRPDLLLPLQALMEQRVAAGHGAEDLSGLVELIRTPA